MTSFRLPHIALPNIPLSNIGLPSFDQAKSGASKIASVAQDAIYVGVGFGVLAVQKLQVRRQELIKRFGSLESQTATIEARLANAEATIGQVVEQIKSRLPEPADRVLDTAYDIAKTTRKQVVDLLTRAA